MHPPAAITLGNEYLRFHGNRQPCGREGIDNQCAVRMSVALGRCNCGFDFSRWTHGLVHDRQGACRDLPPHVTNATNLTHYLRNLGLHFEIYRKAGRNASTAEQIKDRIRGRKGIIYFQHCFGARGSHIDFWNGKEFMNQVLRVSAGGGLPHSSDLFETARGDIWFSALP
jgi:hypothetical protein